MMRPFGAGRRCADSTTSGCAAATAASKIARRRGRLSVMVSWNSRGTCEAVIHPIAAKENPRSILRGFARGDGEALAPDVAVDDVTEALPGLALASLKLNRVVRS